MFKEMKIVFRRILRKNVYFIIIVIIYPFFLTLGSENSFFFIALLVFPLPTSVCFDKSSVLRLLLLLIFLCIFRH